MNMKKIFLLLIAFSFTSAVIAQVEKGNILIKNGNVLTITKGNMEGTDVMIKDGKISQIGKNLVAPAGVKVIDATDRKSVV